MAKKIQLTIPKPCHENWDAMTPVDKGKFCGSCQKQVVDFSLMSDRQVAQFFKKPSTGSVCGRFMTDQLERDIEIPKKRIPWLKYFFTIALPAFFVSVKASASKTQGKIKVSKASSADTTRKPIYDDIKMMGMVARPQGIKPFINDAPAEKGEKGKVVDAATGEALTGADIVMHSTIGKEKINVKADGSFYLNSIRKITIHKIVISLPGYVTMELRFSEFLKLNEGHTVRLVRESVMLGKMAVIPVCDKPIIENPQVEVIKGEVEDTNYQLGKKIEGFILDKKGEPIAGAAIVIKGTRIGTLSKENGEFSIVVDRSGVNSFLIVSAIGYESKEISVSQFDAKRQGDFILSPISLDGLTMGIIVTAKRPKKIDNVVTKMKRTPSHKVTKIDTINLFDVYPNPVKTGSAITIEWKQTEEGYYNLQLINAAGQSVHQKEIWIDAEARLLNIDMPVVAAGSYFLVLINKKSGKKFTEKVVIQ